MSDLWWRITKMKKEAKSPAAKERKRKYETQYESTPARKKYRRELERERRKRGVAGKGGKDMSHTKTGTIVPEDPHTNRARSHPSVGSTLKMVRVMKEQKKLFQGQRTLDGQFAFNDPTDFAAAEQRRQEALKEKEAKRQRMIAVQQHEAMTNEQRNEAFRAKREQEKQAREARRRKNAEGLTPFPRFQQNPE